MIRFIVTSFERLMVVALWLLFIGAGAFGYTQGGVIGALIGLAASFVFAVLFIAPVMIVSDIRKTVTAIEARLGTRASTDITEKAPAAAPVLSAASRTPPAERHVSLSREAANEDARFPLTINPQDTGQDLSPPRKVLRAKK